MSGNSPVAVTGIGLVSAAGCERAAVESALAAGTPLSSELSFFDPTGLRSRRAAVVTVDPAQYFEKKGLRSMDRATKFALVAGKLACEDAGVSFDVESETLGIALGSTYGSLASQGEFDRDGLKNSPSYVNPAMFPLTVSNIQAGQLAIKLRATGPNLSLATGAVASLEAINVAIALIESGQADQMLAGGVDCLSFDLLLHLERVGLMAVEDGGPFLSRSHGLRAGEGAAVLMLETVAHAQARGRKILGVLRGPSSRVARSTSAEDVAAASVSSMRETLAHAGVRASELGWVCSGASGLARTDAAEARAIRTILAEGGEQVPVTSLKGVLGETFSAGGAFQVFAALASLQGAALPRLDAAAEAEGLQLVRAEQRTARPHVLCTATAWEGAANSLLVSAT